MDKKQNYVIGADFGTDSVRVVVLDAANGDIAGQAVSWYPRWKKGLYCNPKENRFRQHPLDYIESLKEAVRASLSQCPQAVPLVRAICIDTTGSTPCLIDEKGLPLAMQPKYAEDPDAMFVLWKDHTAVKEADDINTLAHSGRFTDYTVYSGSVYSSEWFWSKLLHIARKNPKLVADAYSAVEHVDWMPAVLTGTENPKTIKRGRCSAGHKAMWHASWGGYPKSDFLEALHPELARLGKTLGKETYTAEKVAGTLTKQWAKDFGLSEKVIVCCGAMDAHVGAVGGELAPGVMVKSVGTSTCDIVIAPPAEKELVIKGICGQVDGSTIPGYIAYEAGQSGYGDYYAWFRSLLMWGTTDPEREKALLGQLQDAAEKLVLSENDPVATDWINGRRTPFANQNLKAAMMGLSLGTDAPAMMKMLLESTAFGSRAILEALEGGGVKIDQIVAIGGVARKSKFGMQILADVTGREIFVTKGDQSCAIGAAAFAATACGLYPDVPSAQKALAAGIERTHKPDLKKKKIYDKLYEKYLKLGKFEESLL